MNPLMRGSLRPRARISPSSRWNSCATRAGRSCVAIVSTLSCLRFSPPGRALLRLVEERPLLLLGGGERSPLIAEAVAVALDGEAAVDDLELSPVHRPDEVGDLVERL